MNDIVTLALQSQILEAALNMADNLIELESRDERPPNLESTTIPRYNAAFYKQEVVRLTKELRMWQREEQPITPSDCLETLDPLDPSPKPNPYSDLPPGHKPSSGGVF